MQFVCFLIVIDDHWFIIKFTFEFSLFSINKQGDTPLLFF